MIRIAIAGDDRTPARVQTFDDATTVIGRDARCDLILAVPGISARHCRLSPMAGVAGAYVLEDLGSSFGTYVNGTKIDRPVVVSSRDAITVGGETIRIVDARGDPPPATTPAPATPATPEDPWLAEYGRFDALARAWDRAGRPRRGLLRGTARSAAERWLRAGRNRQPAPEPLHRDFVLAAQATARRRVAIAASVLALALATVAGVRLWPMGAAAEPEDFADAAAFEQVPAPYDPTASPPPGDPVELMQRAIALENPDSRLAVQAEVARLPGPLLSDGRFDLLASTQAALAQRRGLALDAAEDLVTAATWAPGGRLLVTGGRDHAIALWPLGAPSPTRPTMLLGHVGPITGLSIDGAGRWLVSASEDRTLRRWDLRAIDPGASAAVLRGHDATIVATAIDPAGRWAVSGDVAGALRVWSLEDGAETAARRDAHEATITGLVFEPAGTLFSASDDRTIRRWRIGEGGELHGAARFEGGTSGLTCLVQTPDGDHLAAGATDGSIALWDLRARTSAPVPLSGHTERVNDLAVSADGRTLVSASDDDTLRVWNLGAADPGVASIVFAGHTGDVTRVELAARDSKAVSTALDHTVRVWDLAKRDRVVDAYVLGEHAGTIGALAIAPDGLWAASTGEQGEVRVWDVLGRHAGVGAKILRGSPAIATDAALTADGRTLVVTGGEDRAELWDLADSARITTPRRLAGASGSHGAAAISPAGDRVAIGGDDGTILTWSVRAPDEAPRTLSGHGAAVHRLAHLPDGRLVSASADGTARVWPVDFDAPPIVLRGHADEIGAMAASSDGRWVVTGGVDGTIVRWDLLAAEPATSAVLLRGHEADVRALVISADGRWLASASHDRRARLWDLPTAETRHVLRGHTEGVTAVAFAPGGTRLATGGADGQIRVWQLDAVHPDEDAQSLLGHEQTVTDLRFVDGPTVLASASNDGRVLLWQLATGERITLLGHDGPVKRLLVGRSPSTLVSIGYDGSARVWPVDGASLATRICDVLGAPADDADLARVFGDAAPTPGCRPPRP